MDGAGKKHKSSIGINMLAEKSLILHQSMQFNLSA